MEILFTILGISVGLWLIIGLILFCNNWMDWSFSKDMRKTYQGYVDSGDNWYKSSVVEETDKMIEASRGMTKSFAWPLRIVGGFNDMITLGRQETSVEKRNAKKLQQEVESAVSKEKARAKEEWEREFRAM